MFRQWLHEKLVSLYPGHDFDVLVPPDASLGDYSVNAAMILAKKEKKNPKELAKTIADKLSSDGSDMIERCEVAGPGFVNIFLKDTYLQEQVGKTKIPAPGAGIKAIIEYPSTNVAKPMHVGHSRPAFIGDSLARVYDALGFEVVRWDHLGDWGTQFGMILAGYKEWGDEDTVKAKPLEALNDIYVQYQAKIAENETYADKARGEFLKLEKGDKENSKLWRWFTKESLKESHEMYKRLGLLEADREVGESAYLKELPALVEELLAGGIAMRSEGAVVVDLEKFGLPTALIQKSDGASVYLTRDIASLRHRLAVEHPARIIYVVANQQALHLAQLFAIAELMGITGVQLVHVKFGLVLGESGKKLSTREGTVVLLSDVLEKAYTKAKEIAQSKEGSEERTDTENVAQSVSIAALKYNDLRQHPHSDIVFDWDAMLDLGGNSGPYLQYTYARLASIIAKAGKGGTADMTLLIHEAERSLMRHLLDFGYAVTCCTQLNTLNTLALYLYELAEKSNSFYEQVRINDDDNSSRKAARLKLITEVMKTLKDGLDLLGIETLERI